MPTTINTLKEATATPYNDIYMRATLTDEGNIPRSGSMCHSPDIIPNGQDSLPEFQQYLKDTWGMDLDKPLTSGFYNYIYVRGKNLANKAQNGEIFLYYSPASLLLWPHTWKNNIIKTSKGNNNVNVSANTVNDIVVGDDAFLWDTPGNPKDDHYCLVSRVVTSDNPNNLPDGMESLGDFGEWVANNPAIGWRNVTIIDKDKPDWKQNVEVKGDWTGNEKTQNIHVIIDCTKIPEGCEIQFLSNPHKGCNPPIEIPKTKTDGQPTFAMGMFTDMEKGYDGNVTVYFWSNGKKIPAGAKIKLLAFIVRSANTKQGAKMARYGKHPSEFNIPEHLWKDTEMPVAQQVGAITGQFK